jgi:hypothetical protein
MPRFVLLYHECPPDYVRSSHWDLMLEAGDALRTWAVAKLPRDWRAAWERSAEIAADCPALADSNLVAAEQLGDHRLAYLQEEGPLSGNRGSVRRIDAGTYEGDDPIVLHGGLIRGPICLRRDSSPPGWILIAGEHVDRIANIPPSPALPAEGREPEA